MTRRCGYENKLLPHRRTDERDRNPRCFDAYVSAPKDAHRCERCNADWIFHAMMNCPIVNRRWLIDYSQVFLSCFTASYQVEQPPAWFSLQSASSSRCAALLPNGKNPIGRHEGQVQPGRVSNSKSPGVVKEMRRLIAYITNGGLLQFSPCVPSMAIITTLNYNVNEKDLRSWLEKTFPPHGGLPSYTYKASLGLEFKASEVDRFYEQTSEQHPQFREVSAPRAITQVSSLRFITSDLSFWTIKFDARRSTNGLFSDTGGRERNKGYDSATAQLKVRWGCWVLTSLVWSLICKRMGLNLIIELSRFVINQNS